MEKTVNNLFNIPELETKSIQEIEKHQNNALQNLLVYLDNNSPFYKNLFKKNQIDLTEIRTIQDLHKIPTTDKQALQENNSDFYCVPSTKIIDYVTTSGTTGKPINFILTNKDLNRLSYNEAISLACAEGSPEDIYQLTTTIDRRFMAGLAYFLGIRELGCGVVRVGSGLPQLQIDTIERVNPTTLIAVPSFILSLIDYAKEINFDLNETSVKKIICIGESIRTPEMEPNTLQNKINEYWKQVTLYSTYASTEMGTAYTECQHLNGGHEHPELIISELLDENNQIITNPDDFGELCITTLGVEGMPLLRFKTGDIVKFYNEPCACGRNTKRISPLIGRKNQMIKYKGTTLFPPAIFDVLQHFKEIESYVIELKHSDVETDEFDIFISLKENQMVNLDFVSEFLRAKLRIKPKVFIISQKEVLKKQFQNNTRKPVYFIDKRV